MNQRLREAANCGDVNSLYSIIQEDAYILDSIDQVPFVDSPLHISAAAGHVHFSMEILRLKPSFAKKLNPNGFTPIHLAIQNNQTETVLQFIEIDRDLVSVAGREGLTPLHIVAYRGQAEMLAKFLVYCPKSIKDLTVHRETVLHIAVRIGNVESLNILLEWIQQASCLATILNWKDNGGNNIMHLAALTNQIEIVKLLIKKVDATAKNMEGLTPLDIMKERGFLENSELRKMLGRARILKEARFLFPTLKDTASFLWWMILFVKRLFITDNREIIRMSKEDKNAILVVSVLIATATYQALLSPPEDDYLKGLQEWNILPSKAVQYSILSFRYCNTIAFVASMIEICVHLPSGIGYSLHLVLPLVICYTLLMLVRWSCTFMIIIGVAICVFLMLKAGMIRLKVWGELKPEKLVKPQALFKHNPNLERELTEMNLHFRQQ